MGKKIKEHVERDIIGNKIFVNDETGMRVKKYSAAWFLYSGEQYCPECHVRCDYQEENEYWQCPNCYWGITEQESKDGEGYPTLEATYADDFGD